jgi:hypothetical protein
MSKISRLREAVLDGYHEHRARGELPTSGRFLYYELEQAGIVPKTRRGAQDVSEALTDVRQGGQIPWEDIVDETRSLDSAFTSPTILDGVISLLSGVLIDRWKGRPPMVLTESRSLAGVLRVLVRDEYRARIAATNGQTGGFLHTELAPVLEAGDRVLYLGDLDLAGAQIEANTRRVLERLGGPLQWERLALTKEQADFYHLEPIIKLDNRYKPAREHEAIETEALRQSVIVDIVRTRLSELLPCKALDRVLVQERRQRSQILLNSEGKRNDHARQRTRIPEREARKRHGDGWGAGWVSSLQFSSHDRVPPAYELN